MKHIFIINPAAGKQNAHESIRSRLEAGDIQADWEIYLTKGTGDATAYVRSYCEQHISPVRFYACGGDGTLNEVANGIVGFPHASLGCHPSGSGNDFVKYYGNKEAFLDIKAQIEAEEEYIDLMRIGNRYAINTTNFGFDSCVASVMHKIRRKKLIGGKNAYTTGVIVGLLKAMKNPCVVTADGEVLNPNGKMLLCTIANGQYVGGSFRCAPRSLDNDGLLEVCLVSPISRFTFIKLVGKYKEGSHLDNPKFEKFVRYKRAKTVHIKAPEGFIYTLDGELIEEPEFTVEVIPSAIRFAVPKGTSPLPGDAHIPLTEKEPALTH